MFITNPTSTAIFFLPEGNAGIAVAVLVVLHAPATHPAAPDGQTQCTRDLLNRNPGLDVLQVRAGRWYLVWVRAHGWPYVPAIRSVEGPGEEVVDSLGFLRKYCVRVLMVAVGELPAPLLLLT